MPNLHTPIHRHRVEEFASSTMPILAQQYELNGTYEPHSHDFIEVVFILTGTGRHSTQYGDSALKAGDLISIRPGSWHAYQACQALLVYNCCFALELLDQQLAWLRDDPRIAGLFWSTSESTQGITQASLPSATLQACLEQLEHLHALIEKNPQQQVHLRLIGHLLVVFGLVAEGLQQAPLCQPPFHRAVLDGMQLFEERLAHPWTLKEVANAVHIDHAYFVRLFTAQIGCAPMTWLARKRVEYAATLLAHTELPITRIATEVGWPDPAHFARRFKAQMHMSASAYRTLLIHEHVQPDITHEETIYSQEIS